MTCEVVTSFSLNSAELKGKGTGYDFLVNLSKLTLPDATIVASCRGVKSEKGGCPSDANLLT
jgi:hypothetical protein